MIIHAHSSEDGNLQVMHVSNVEAKSLVEAISSALNEAPEAEEFVITLGLLQEEPVEDA